LGSRGFERATSVLYLTGRYASTIACVVEVPRQSELADMDVAAWQQHD
jgi:hypothetical protein